MVTGDLTRWLAEDPAFCVLEISRGKGRELVRSGMLAPKQDGIFRVEDIVQGALLKRFRSDLGGATESTRVWTSLRQDGSITRMVKRGLSAPAAARYQVIIEQRRGRMTAAVNDDQLLEAISEHGEQRLLIAEFHVELSAYLEAFRRRAEVRPVEDVPRRGRPRKSGTLHQLPPPRAQGG